MEYRANFKKVPASMELKPCEEIPMADYVFPASVIGKYLPHETDIPKEFWNHRGIWSDLMNMWFFKGLDEDFKPLMKEGIDEKKAIIHLSTCMRSFEPKHEHKEAGVSYLMSLWFDEGWVKNFVEGKRGNL